MNHVIGIAVKHGNTRRIDEFGNDFASSDIAAYFAEHPTYKGIAATEVDGQQMVLIPAFYVASGSTEDGAAAFWISPEEKPGFHLHPAFMHRGEPLPHFLVSAYEGSMNGGLKMCSAPGAGTAGDRSFHDMRAACLARNVKPMDGWDMWNIYQLAALQRLALIEAGSTDSQAAFGRGHVNGCGLKPAGQHDSWRGIHDLWGNSWSMVYGLETDENHQIILLDNQGHGTMLPTGIKTPCDDSSFIAAMHDESGQFFNLGDIFLPKAVTGDQEEALYPDYFWKSWPGEHNVAYHGGGWRSGSGAGLFTLALHSPASDSYTYIGCRLAKV